MTMELLKTLARRFFVLLAVCGVVVMISCGTDDGLGKRYSVSGTVTYNDNPLERGTISFVPEDSKRNVGASGEIEKGSYTLSTGGNNDGAQAGKYKVTITSKEDYIAKATEAFKKEPRSGGQGAKLPPSSSEKPTRQPRASSPPGMAMFAPRR
jgi:hypothetical protein